MSNAASPSKGAGARPSRPATRVTSAQRAWVQQLAGMGGAPAAAPEFETTAPVAAERDGAQAFVPGLGDIPGLVKTLLSDLSCKCRVINRTNRVLTLDPGSIKFVSGKFKKDPPAKIPPNREVKFLAVNKFPNTAGVEGELIYRLDDQKTGWRIHFNNPRLGDNTSDTEVEGPNEASFIADADNAQGPEADFEYTLELAGSPQPGPIPPPGPTPTPVPPPAPTPDLAASCSITITNNTPAVLTLAGQGHERGDFMTFPAQTLQPGASTSFVSIETPNSPDEGCKGFLTWEVGSPVTAVWRIEWENGEKTRNTANATLSPQTAGFRSLEQIGQGDENVPVAFTISGGAAVPPKPVPPPGPSPAPTPVPPPEPEPEFAPPPESKQVTLRKGDKSKDGWVEYAQRLLNAHLGTNLVIDGSFGPAMHKAVLDFQKKNKLQVDGTVGNQTWAALRQDTPEAPSTDGRKPHSFVEEGAEARWATESKDNNRYVASSDEFQLLVNSVGDQKIDDVEATLRVTPPGAKPKVVKVKLGAPHKESATGAGQLHMVKLAKFKKTFPPADPNAKVTDYVVEAFLPKELGGDFYKANVREA